MRLFNLKIAVMLCGVLATPLPAVAAEVAGWVEPALLLPNGIHFLAKLDTGARHSSLNSQKIQTIEINGITQVRFEVRGRHGKVHTLQLPLLRMVTIKRHFGKSQQRPVVEMQLCLGKLSKKVEVNLVDRSGFNYQLLLGRSFLAPQTLVDSARQNITEPRC